jgi:hypothetical protein
MRAYDKFRESGKEEYRGCVRYEIELKGRISKAVWKMAREGNLSLMKLLEMVRQQFMQQGVTMPQETISEDVTVIPRREKTPIERTRAWMYTMLPKSISNVSLEYGIFDVLRGLLQGSLTDFELSGIIKVVSLSWGN